MFSLTPILGNHTNLPTSIVFTANNHEDDFKNCISRYLMAFNDAGDKHQIKAALYDWNVQKQKSYELWTSTYVVELKKNGFCKLDNQHDWCGMAEVTVTQIPLLNGYRLPDLYLPPDLKYMLE